MHALLQNMKVSKVYIVIHNFFNGKSTIITVLFQFVSDQFCSLSLIRFAYKIPRTDRSSSFLHIIATKSISVILEKRLDNVRVKEPNYAF